MMVKDPWFHGDLTVSPSTFPPVFGLQLKVYKLLIVWKIETAMHPY